jgi:DeoR/GlpR family transcriptional regulator of sugar metabolism
VCDLLAYTGGVLAAERRRLVLRAVGARHGATVAELADGLKVSVMTIRRDLETLATEGKLTRVHGGAVPVSSMQRHAFVGATFSENTTHRVAEKFRIGVAAAELVCDGETILLDVGTTTLQLARQLRGRSLTVITNSLAVSEELLGDADIELILLGGVVDRHYRSLAGVLAEEALRHVRADRLFLSASAIRGSDLSVLDDTAVDHRLKRRMIGTAGSVVLLADAQKFFQMRPARVCGPEDLDVLVTDTGAPADVLAAFEAAGVRVIRA